jgi:hypothetical protein
MPIDEAWRFRSTNNENSRIFFICCASPVRENRQNVEMLLPRFAYCSRNRYFISLYCPEMEMCSVQGVGLLYDKKNVQRHGPRQIAND